MAECILVMALLATLLALSAPHWARIRRGRVLLQEGDRLIAWYERARMEAQARALPHEVWIDEEAARVGITPSPGFPGRETRMSFQRFADGLRIQDPDRSAPGARWTAVAFGPDGAPVDEHTGTLVLTDRRGDRRYVVRDRDGWHFANLSPEDYEARRAQENVP